MPPVVPLPRVEPPPLRVFPRGPRIDTTRFAAEAAKHTTALVGIGAIGTRYATDVALQFHNTGLYDAGGGAYPEPSPGLVAATGREEDRGKFRAPSLRNVTVTAPYMHDGSVETLGDVIDHYARGGRLIESGADAGDGRDNPFKSELLRGFTLEAGEREDLLAFLHALTDEAFLSDPRLTDPWR